MGRPVAFTLDVPRCPARIAQAGAVWLASATGQPLLPYHIEADRYWSLHSWDRTQIPKPFARVALVIGQAMDVPPDLAETDLDAHSRVLESALAKLEGRAATLVASGSR